MGAGACRSNETGTEQLKEESLRMDRADEQYTSMCNRDCECGNHFCIGRQRRQGEISAAFLFWGVIIERSEISCYRIYNLLYVKLENLKCDFLVKFP